MRRALLMCALLLALPAIAQEKAKTPSGLEPLPEVPPPPPGVNLDAGPEVEQRVVIRPEGESVEYRVGGKLFAIKVTPKIGAPYYLVDVKGDGNFTHRDDIGSGVRPPQWLLLQF